MQLAVGRAAGPAGQALAWRGPMASGALAQLIEGDWGDTELLLVDLPPGTGDVQLSLVQKARPDGAVIVSTPQDLALIDATRAIDLFGKTGVPVLGLDREYGGLCLPALRRGQRPVRQRRRRGSGEASSASPSSAACRLSASLRDRVGRGPAAGRRATAPAAEAFAELARRLLEPVGDNRRAEALGRQRRRHMPLTRDEDIAELLPRRADDRHGRRVGPPRPRQLSA